MARSKLKAAQEKLTDEEREKMRAVVLPLGGVDGIVRALRDAPVADDQVARVWDRVSERILREGGRLDAPLGAQPAASTLPGPKGYTFTGAQIAGALAGVFLLGAFSGASVHALLPRDKARITAIEAEIRPPPLPAPERPESVPSASAVHVAG